MEQTNVKRLHYHLVTGEVIFQPNGMEDVNAIRVNGIVADEDNRIPVRLIAKAQQILQMNFFKKSADITPETVKIVDCVMFGFTYLGQFTAEEFHKAPEGMSLQERQVTPQSQEAPAQTSQHGNGPIQVIPFRTVSTVSGASKVSLEDAVAGASKN